MNEMPKLTYGYNDHGYALIGWEDFDRYGRLNWPLWARLDHDCKSLSELDTLRMMLAAYAVEFERVHKEYVDYKARNPEHVIHVDGHVYRYVGP